MLITGYFLFGRTIPFSKRVRKAGKVLYAILFYGAVITVIHFIVLKFLYPFSSYESYTPIFTFPNWLDGKNQWYLQAYVLFILLILPVLKTFEAKLTKTTHLCLALTLIFVHLCAYSEFLPNLWISSRMIDFIMCYYLGGYFSKYKVKIGWKKLALLFTGYLVLYFTYEYYWRYSCSVLYEPSAYSYISVMQPFICCIVFSVLCFLAANNLALTSDFYSGVSETLASATIGIYIFHFNLITISFILADTFWWHDWSRNGYFLFTIADTLLLFVLGFLVDQVRQWTYKPIEKKLNQVIPDC